MVQHVALLALMENVYTKLDGRARSTPSVDGKCVYKIR
jgi:hypothetical protein